MLVLTRRAGEAVMIDGHIEIKVLRIRGNQVHLGIDAPTETLVHRHEVWLRLQQEGEPVVEEGTPGQAHAEVADPLRAPRPAQSGAAMEDGARS